MDPEFPMLGVGHMAEWVPTGPKGAIFTKKIRWVPNSIVVEYRY